MVKTTSFMEKSGDTELMSPITMRKKLVSTNLTGRFGGILGWDDKWLTKRRPFAWNNRIEVVRQKRKIGGGPRPKLDKGKLWRRNEAGEMGRSRESGEP